MASATDTITSGSEVSVELISVESVLVKLLCPSAPASVEEICVLSESVMNAVITRVPESAPVISVESALLISAPPDT